MKDETKTMRWILWSLIMLLAGSIVTKVIDSRSQKKQDVSSGRWAKIELILQQIEQNYVDEVDYEKVTENFLPYLMQQLDPHSVYLPPKNLEEANQELEGNIEGIGITFNVPEDTAIVISIVRGGPSERAGILSGDKIIRIDGEPVAGVKMPQDSMVARMRGISGTQVRLGVLRDGAMVDFDIRRDKIPVKSIDVAYMLNDTTGYMKLTKFTRTSYMEFRKAAASLREQGMKRLLFDLQDNTGGYLDQALLLANEFLKEGQLIVYMEGAHRDRQDFTADGRGKYQDIELFVLVNQNSASSSEIFAGSMQDNDRGLIFGKRSYGKGVVQEPIYFTDNSGIRLTVARFYTATGRCIQKPYDSSDDYMYDIYDRYAHGEMTEADSIPKNDSLRYQTPGGKTVYGGGGIIPDVFVPIDTTGVSDLLIEINRNSYTVKYSSVAADEYKKELRDVHSLSQLNAALDKMDLEDGFMIYLKEKGLKVRPEDWRLSGEIIMTQLRALVGRYSPLDDNAFYPIIDELDNTITTARDYRN